MKANCSGCIIGLVGLAAAAVGLAASSTLIEWHGFNGADGSVPGAPLLQASDGNFYGTTFDGGDDGSGCVQGCDGTVFKITAQGQLTLLHTFVGGGTNPPYQDGRNPWGGLAEGPDGALYGTTFNGGYPFSHGIVYRISKTGQFQKLHDFCNTTPCSDGTNPQGSLAVGNDGFFYGTLTNPPAFPKAFRVSSTGAYQVMAEFYNTGLGTPAKGLVRASDGNFYGVGSGGVYRLTPGGQLSVLYFFQGADGGGNDALIQALDGNLYGATSPGPGNSGCVFRMSLTGNFQKILALTGTGTGTFPNALVQASDGNLWGTANVGGTSAGGTIFNIATDGTWLQTLSLTMRGAGIRPMAPLIQATDGRLYGTTSEYGVLPDGSPAAGTIVVVDAGLSPTPGSGGVGISPGPRTSRH
jgi:uncharacterized repeat protein (TIGR03803 family)